MALLFDRRGSSAVASSPMLVTLSYYFYLSTLFQSISVLILYDHGSTLCWMKATFDWSYIYVALWGRFVYLTLRRLRRATGRLLRDTFSLVSRWHNENENCFAGNHGFVEISWCVTKYRNCAETNSGSPRVSLPNNGSTNTQHAVTVSLLSWRQLTDRLRVSGADNLSN